MLSWYVAKNKWRASFPIQQRRMNRNEEINEEILILFICRRNKSFIKHQKNHFGFFCCEKNYYSVMASIQLWYIQCQFECVRHNIFATLLNADNNVELLSIKIHILTKDRMGNVDIVEFVLIIIQLCICRHINSDLFVSLDATIVIVNKQSTTTCTHWPMYAMRINTHTHRFANDTISHIQTTTNRYRWRNKM